MTKQREIIMTDETILFMKELLTDSSTFNKKTVKHYMKMIKNIELKASIKSEQIENTFERLTFQI